MQSSSPKQPSDGVLNPPSGSASRRVVVEQPTVISNPTRMPSADSGSGHEGQTSISSGARLGPFKLLECVGGGGMGRVFRGLDTVLGRTVAIKILSGDQAADPDTLLRFRNEAQTVARLNHENIVQVYHAGEEGGIPYIVFEFIEGRNIRALVEQKGPLPLAEAISYTFQVAEALAHAVDRNVVHRDIKPSNVLVVELGRVKLIDLGLARMHKSGDPANDLTASGVTLGTFDYISPEQARDPRTADVRSDIYSLGCTLFFMLSGRPPFPEGTVLQKLLQHQGEEPPDVRATRPELPSEVSRVLRKMMAKDPRRRYQTPSQLIRELVALAKQIGLSPAGPGETMWNPAAASIPSFLRRHLPWAAPVAVLLGIVMVLHFLRSVPRSEYSSGPRETVVVEGTASATQQTREPAAPQQNAEEIPDFDQEFDEGMPPDVANETKQPKGHPDPRSESTSDGGSSSDHHLSMVARETASGAMMKPEATETGIGSAKAPRASQVAPMSAELGKTGAGKPDARATPRNTAKKEADAPVADGPRASTPPSAIPAHDAECGPGAGILVVGGASEKETAFASLAAAFSGAASGDVIELRYSGPREEKPFVVANSRITVRAGEGYQPAIVFRPNQVDPILYPRAMLTLADSQLTFVNVAIEVDLPGDLPAEQWSLVEMRQADSVQVRKMRPHDEPHRRPTSRLPSGRGVFPAEVEPRR